MHGFTSNRWRRDVLVGLLAAVFTGGVLAPLGWAALQQQRGEAAKLQRSALEAAALARRDAAIAHDQAQRALLNQAADVLANFGGPANADAEMTRVTTKAVTPEIPEGAYLLAILNTR
ncbi:MAG TPA: hypothetical protein VJ783_14380 [Pirellulales bacterium]|nr:hypothetical protein [Pirellulales bacterium]